MNNHHDQGGAEVLSWDTKYNGSAIYALVGSNGKEYIGQTSHLQQRLMAHRSEFRRILNATDKQIKSDRFLEGKKMIEAIRAGVTFKVRILKSFPEVYQASKNDRFLWENYYLNQAGGLKETYNDEPSGVVNDFYEPSCTPVTWDEYESMEEAHQGIHKMPKRKRPFVLTILLDDDDDSDIIERLNQIPQKQKSYIKELIRKDIRK